MDHLDSGNLGVVYEEGNRGDDECSGGSSGGGAAFIFLSKPSNPIGVHLLEWEVRLFNNAKNLAR